MDVHEKDLARVGVGTEVEVTVEAYPDRTFRGSLEYLSNLLDPSTRTAQARVVIANGDGRLRPGMFASATITIPSADGASVLVLPRHAIQRVRGRQVVFVEKQPGMYEVRGVELGRDAGRNVEVRSGLVDGERAVTAGSFYLKSTLLKEEIGNDED